MKKWHDFNEGFDSQRMFRLILEAIANPARKVDIRVYAEKFHAGRTPLLAVGMTLLDNEVSFYAHGDDALSGELASLTLARRETPENADFLFVVGAENAETLIPCLKCGTLRDPHLSATVVVLDNGASDQPLRLYGPGIDGTVDCMVSKAARAAILARDRQCYEYPQGIDLVFVSDGGELYAVPRRTLREVR